MRTKVRTKVLKYVVLLMVLVCGNASATDSVIVESKVVSPGAQNVEIAIRVSNDRPVASVEVPLEIRQGSGGAYITRAKLCFDERLLNALPEIRITNQYSTKSDVCQSGGPGFRYPVGDSAGVFYPVTASPWGLVFVAFGYPSSPELSVGSDTTGSLVIVVDIANQTGTFEIDTTCITPNNHLRYLERGSSYITHVPSFQKGIVAVNPCDCSFHGDLDGNGAIDGVDLSILIDWIYAAIGPPPTDSTCPHVDRGDVDCSGADDSADISLMVDVVYFGGSACGPCDCNPYPTACP